MNAPETRNLAPESDILAAVESLEREMVELATTLVRFPTLNGDEAGAQDFLEGLFRRMGLAGEHFEMGDADLKNPPGHSPSIGQRERHDHVVAPHRPPKTGGPSLVPHRPPAA